jgi:type III secretion protein R
MTFMALAAAADRGGSLTTRPLTLIFAMAALSLLPFVLLLVTSFVRIAVVLSILKGALGTPQIPPNQVITGLAMLLTLYVMAPTGERMYRAIEPLLERSGGASVTSIQSIQVMEQAAQRVKEPLRDFLLKHSNARDRALFHGLSLRMRAPTERTGITDRDLLIIVPAFLTSELRRAFEIGFLLFVPFLVVDMVIANILLALGMHMLSPTTVSLPFKLLLFVLADGWQLILRGLVESYV